MPKISATITIEDKDASDLFAALLEMEVEEDHRLATMFRIKLSIHRDNKGLWTFLDDERIRLWKKVVIASTVSREETELISGYITQLVPHLEPDENRCTLEIHGLDATSLMSLEEKIKDWPNKKDSDIAREIFQHDYELTPEVEDTAVVHNEAAATIIQRETDIQFLKRLARRNGFECFVQAGKGFFRKPALADKHQPPLSIHFGNETNLVSFEARVNALRPTAVEMRQFDTIGKEVMAAAAKSGKQRRLGRESALSIAPPHGSALRLFVRHAVTTGQPEMENLCRAMFDEAEWFVEARGEVDSAFYCASLRARKPAPVRGAGELFSGIYYVTSVRHVFTPDRYAQHFTARRNALAPSGEEDLGGLM